MAAIRSKADEMFQGQVSRIHLKNTKVNNADIDKSRLEADIEDSH